MWKADHSKIYRLDLEYTDAGEEYHLDDIGAAIDDKEDRPDILHAANICNGQYHIDGDAAQTATAKQFVSFTTAAPRNSRRMDKGALSADFACNLNYHMGTIMQLLEHLSWVASAHCAHRLDDRRDAEQREQGRKIPREDFDDSAQYNHLTQSGVPVWLDVTIKRQVDALFNSATKDSTTKEQLIANSSQNNMEKVHQLILANVRT